MINVTLCMMRTCYSVYSEPVGKKNRPLKDIVIQSVVVHANPIADEEAL